MSSTSNPYFIKCSGSISIIQPDHLSGGIYIPYHTLVLYSILEHSSKKLTSNLTTMSFRLS